MSERNNQVYLNDIAESIQAILNYVSEKTEFEFSQNLMMQDAVIRRFAIIGEAASKISDDFQNLHPEIEWRLMKDMRNKLIHEYFGISSQSVYRTITNDLPSLAEKIKKLI